MRNNLLKEKHNGGLARHFNHDKTYAQHNSSYYWPGMRSNVNKFVDRCKICQYEKGKQQNIVLYQPLPILDIPWDDIIMDFVLRLQRTQRGSDSIVIMVDQF
jgi:hypothetical protein